MKINEIIINDEDLLWEALKSNIAIDVINVYKIISSQSRDGKIHAVDILTRDEIADFLYDVKSLKKDALYIFDNDSQTMKVIF